ncbi:MAG: hypothetical protein WC861_05575 [Candidatus Micrarchaeia archaeon]|jgi:hypothetical protein
MGKKLTKDKKIQITVGVVIIFVCLILFMVLETKSTRILFEEKDGVIELKSLDYWTPPMSILPEWDHLTGKFFNVSVMDLKSGKITECAGNGMQKGANIWLPCELGARGEKNITANIYRDGVYIQSLNKMLLWPPQ